MRLTLCGLLVSVAIFCTLQCLLANDISCPVDPDQKKRDFTAKGTMFSGWFVECYAYNDNFDFFFGDSTYPTQLEWESKFDIPAPPTPPADFVFGAVFNDGSSVDVPAERKLQIGAFQDCNGAIGPNVVTRVTGPKFKITNLRIDSNNKLIDIDGEVTTTKTKGVDKVVVFLSPFSRSKLIDKVDVKANKFSVSGMNFAGVPKGRYMLVVVSAAKKIGAHNQHMPHIVPMSIP